MLRTRNLTLMVLVALGFSLMAAPSTALAYGEWIGVYARHVLEGLEGKIQKIQAMAAEDLNAALDKRRMEGGLLEHKSGFPANGWSLKPEVLEQEKLADDLKVLETIMEMSRSNQTEEMEPSQEPSQFYYCNILAGKLRKLTKTVEVDAGSPSFDQYINALRKISEKICPEMLALIPKCKDEVDEHAPAVEESSVGPTCPDISEKGAQITARSDLYGLLSVAKDMVLVLREKLREERRKVVEGAPYQGNELLIHSTDGINHWRLNPSLISDLSRTQDELARAYIVDLTGDVGSPHEVLKPLLGRIEYDAGEPDQDDRLNAYVKLETKIIPSVLNRIEGYMAALERKDISKDIALSMSARYRSSVKNFLGSNIQQTPTQQQRPEDSRMKDADSSDDASVQVAPGPISLGNVIAQDTTIQHQKEQKPLLSPVPQIPPATTSLDDEMLKSLSRSLVQTANIDDLMIAELERSLKETERKKPRIDRIVVKEGDTLGKYAMQLREKFREAGWNEEDIPMLYPDLVDIIVRANPSITDPNFIYAGSELYLPHDVPSSPAELEAWKRQYVKEASRMRSGGASQKKEEQGQESDQAAVKHDGLYETNRRLVESLNKMEYAFKKKKLLDDPEALDRILAQPQKVDRLIKRLELLGRKAKELSTRVDDSEQKLAYRTLYLRIQLAVIAAENYKHTTTTSDRRAAAEVVQRDLKRIFDHIHEKFFVGPSHMPLPSGERYEL